MISKPRHLFLPFVLLTACVLFLYAESFVGELNQLDDIGYIVEYGHYDRSLDASGIRDIFVTIAAREKIHDYYRPIYTLVRILDYKLYGTSAFGYHITNTLFYLLAVFGVYLILLKLLKEASPALLGALLFAAHPIHVEAVTWIMSGGHLVSASFIFLAFYFYLSRKIAPSIIAYSVAGLSYPASAIFPFLALGHYWVSSSKANKAEAARRKILVGLFVVAGAVALINFILLPEHYTVSSFDTATAFRTLTVNFFRYGRLMLLPLGLMTPWEGYVDSFLNIRFFSGLAMAAGLVWGYFWLRPISNNSRPVF